MLFLKLNIFNRMPSFKMRIKRRSSESSTDSDNSPSTPNNTPPLSYITFHDANSKASLKGLFDYEFDEIKDCVSPISCHSMDIIIPSADQGFATFSNEIDSVTPPNTPVDGYTSFFPIFVEDLQERLEKLSCITLKEEVVAKEEVIREESLCATPQNSPVDGATAFFPIFVEDLKERLERLSISNSSLKEEVVAKKEAICNKSACATPPNTPVDGYTSFFPIFVEDLQERLAKLSCITPKEESVGLGVIPGEGFHACPTPFNTPVLVQDAFVAVKACSSPIETKIALRVSSFDPISIKGLQKSLSDIVAPKKLRSIPELLEEGGHHVQVVGAYTRMVKFALPALPVRAKKMDAITKSRMRLFT